MWLCYLAIHGHGFVHGIGKIDNNRLNISKIINNFKL